MTVHEVNGDGPEAANSAAEHRRGRASVSKHEVSGEYIDVRFPPHSFTLLEVHWPEHECMNTAW